MIVMNKYENAPILDPDDYNPNDYEKDQLVRYQDGDNLVNAIITDVDYIGGGIAVEYDTDNDGNPDEKIKF